VDNARIEMREMSRIQKNAEFGGDQIRCLTNFDTDYDRERGLLKDPPFIIDVAKEREREISNEQGMSIWY
jgi:hypothetical protein